MRVYFINQGHIVRHLGCLPLFSMNVSTALNIPVQISRISSLGSYLEMLLGEKVRTILRANVQLVKDTLQKGYVSFHRLHRLSMSRSIQPHAPSPRFC